MRPIWKGAISFGLVTIPVQIVNATNEAEKISFKMLRKGDLSPIRYRRVAEIDEKEVAWGDIVKGYEYEKGQFVVMDEKDFEKVDLKGTDSIEILDFVAEQEVEPIYFYKPYYIEPTKGGGPAYALLREVLADTGKIGIAKVIIRQRQHLAAVKAKGDLLVLELMHFAAEITPAEEVKVPAAKGADKRALAMARTLVEQMSTKWEPARYVDEYAEKMKELIDKKIAAGGHELPEAKKHAAPPTNVVDLVAVLEQSLGQAGKKGARKGSRAAGAEEEAPGEKAEIIPSRIKRRAPAAKRASGHKPATKRRTRHKSAA
jgi:DNA end-binding protein Ku